jgi:hypothetical protein
MNENNNVRQNLEGFRDRMMARVKQRMTGPSLVDDLNKQNEKKAEKKSPWFAEFRSDRATYVIMAISGVFTAILGLILGLAPEMQTTPEGLTYIYFHTDFLHVVIALIYAVAFVTVTEAAFLVAKNKFHGREEANPTQHNTMIAMMILAGISIVGTGLAGSMIGASVLGFLTDFQEIPHSAQKWVVGVIPVLLAVYAYLLTAYKLSSEEEKANRLTEQMKRQQQREHKLQMDLAELEAEEMMMLAESKAYLEAVERGVLTAAEASAAKKAGKTLKQLERERGEDLNGDRKVEGRQRPAPKTPPHPLEQYKYLRPPYGDRNHPDLVEARIPMDIWEVITREWAIQDGMNPDDYLPYLDNKIRSLPSNRKNGVNP